MCVIDDKLKLKIKECWCNASEDSFQLLEEKQIRIILSYTQAVQKLLGLCMMTEFSRNPDHSTVLKVPFFSLVTPCISVLSVTLYVSEDSNLH